MRDVRILFPCVDIARDTVVRGLSELGASVTPIVTYRTVLETSLPANVLTMLEQKAIQMVTFASSSTVEAFVKAVGHERLDNLLAGVSVGCIGPATARTAVDMGMTVDIMPDEATIPAFVEAIERRISKLAN